MLIILVIFQTQINGLALWEAYSIFLQTFYKNINLKLQILERLVNMVVVSERSTLLNVDMHRKLN